MDSLQGWYLFEVRGIDGVIDVCAACGLEADPGGCAPDAANGIETSGQRGDAHEVGDAGDVQGDMHEVMRIGVRVNGCVTSRKPHIRRAICSPGP
jgi:hypothetical protein